MSQITVNDTLQLAPDEIEAQFRRWMSDQQLSVSAQRNAATVCRALVSWYSKMNRTVALASLSVDDIAEFLAGQQVSTETLRGKLGYLSRLIDWAGGNGKQQIALYKANYSISKDRQSAQTPAARVDAQYLAPTDVNRIWHWIDSAQASDDLTLLRDAMIVGILLDVGLKIAEIQRLNVVDVVRLNGNKLALQVGARVLALSAKCLQELLPRWLIARTEHIAGEVLIPTLDDRKGQAGSRCSAPTLFLCIRRVLERADVKTEQHGGQLLRTTCMVRRIQCGEPYQDIAAFFGVSVVAIDRVARTI